MITIRPKAFFFDFDGVIVDSERVHMFAALRSAATHNISFNEDYYFKQLLGYDDVGLFHHLWKDHGLKLDESTLKDLIRGKNRAFLEEISAKAIFFSGIREFIGRLENSGVPLAIVSGALENEIDACLVQGGLRPHFKFIVSADKVRASKPDPESYEKAWEDMLDYIPNLKKEECWSIEDSPAGIAAAADAGIHVIGITNSVRADHLKRADHIITHVDEINVS